MSIACEVKVEHSVSDGTLVVTEFRSVLRLLGQIWENFR